MNAHRPALAEGAAPNRRVAGAGTAVLQRRAAGALAAAALLLAAPVAVLALLAGGGSGATPMVLLSAPRQPTAAVRHEPSVGAHSSWAGLTTALARAGSLAEGEVAHLLGDAPPAAPAASSAKAPRLRRVAAQLRRVKAVAAAQQEERDIERAVHRALEQTAATQSAVHRARAEQKALDLADEGFKVEPAGSSASARGGSEQQASQSKQKQRAREDAQQKALHLADEGFKVEQAGSSANARGSSEQRASQSKQKQRARKDAQQKALHLAERAFHVHKVQRVRPRSHAAAKKRALRDAEEGLKGQQARPHARSGGGNEEKALAEAEKAFATAAVRQRQGRLRTQAAAGPARAVDEVVDDGAWKVAPAPGGAWEVAPAAGGAWEVAPAAGCGVLCAVPAAAAREGGGSASARWYAAAARHDDAASKALQHYLATTPPLAHGSGVSAVSGAAGGKPETREAGVPFARAKVWTVAAEKADMNSYFDGVQRRTERHVASITRLHHQVDPSTAAQDGIPQAV